jgi:hypothetical protein
MRTIVLSDHPATNAQRHARARHDKFEAEKSAYNSELLQRQTRSADLNAIGQQQLREGHFFGWIVTQVRRILHATSAQPNQPSMRQADTEEIVWNAGSHGEAIVAQTLGAALGDDWFLLKGYCNSAGEIDQILVGPSGIVALEVKYVTGVIHCDGNRWWRDRYDQWGNIVATAEALQDRRGRSPSDQVNAVANRLQEFLRKRSTVSRVYRVVIFSHENAQLGELRAIAFNRALTLPHLQVANLFPPTPQQTIDPRAVAALVQQDYEFHQRRRDRARAARIDQPALA